VLASQFVVPQEKCTPNSYNSLQILSPARASYASGSVEFDDGDGNPIAGLPARSLDATGTASLSGLELNTPTGLPQFLITLIGETGAVGAVEVELSWTATFEPGCVGQGTKVTPTPTTVTTKLSGGGQSGESISVNEGTPVTDSASLAGTDAAHAGGKLTYKVYSDAACSKEVASAGEVTVTNGSPGSSNPQTLAPGIYYWQASYGGDEGNEKAVSKCGAEVETVGSPAKPLNPGTTQCNGIFKGSGKDVVVPAGAVCTLVAGTRVSHDVQVQKGGTLIDQGALIEHDIQAMSARGIALNGGSVGHDVGIQGLTGPATGANYVCAVNVGHDLRVEGALASAAMIVIGESPSCTSGNSVGHDLSVQNNAPAVQVVGNGSKATPIGHDLLVQGNQPGGATITNNWATHNASCSANKPQSGSGNHAATSSCPK